MAGAPEDGSTEAAPRIKRAPEIIWALIPALALALVFAGSWHGLRRVSDAGPLPPSSPEQPATVKSAPTLFAEQSVTQPRREKPARRKLPQETQLHDDVVVPTDAADQEMQPR